MTNVAVALATYWKNKKKKTKELFFKFQGKITLQFDFVYIYFLTFSHDLAKTWKWRVHFQS